MRKYYDHFCRHCGTDFHFGIDVDECGDFLLECPTCGERHYRYFEDGVVVHCEPSRATAEPRIILGVIR